MRAYSPSGLIDLEDSMVAARAVRLTPLGVMVLALLGEGDMHPYEILRRPRKTWTEEWEAADTAGMGD